LSPLSILVVAQATMITFSGCSNDQTETKKTQKLEINNKMKFTLPQRDGSAPEVGATVPQLQFSDKSPELIRKKLWEWSFSTFPDVTEEDTRISVHTSRALWLDPKVPVAHRDCFMPPAGSREFCHMHLDGSIHAVVSDADEEEIIAKNWGKRHPMYHTHGVKEVIVYAPRNEEEIFVLQLVIAQSYEYATGRRVSIKK